MFKKTRLNKLKFRSKIKFREPHPENGDKLRKEIDKTISDIIKKNSTPIIEKYPSFIHQLQILHYIGMHEHENIMLSQAQKNRLFKEKVKKIAGEIRNIQIGFGEYRFNGPSPLKLNFLLKEYETKISEMIKNKKEYSFYDIVSFAQYYFALLHPFYERCGRTSEDLIYLLYEQANFKKRKYISHTSKRNSPLSYERMKLINNDAEKLNKVIGKFMKINTKNITKTPHIYKEIVKKYFNEEYYKYYEIGRKRPYYYTHPIKRIIEVYDFIMTSILHYEITSFNPKENKIIKNLSNHLKNKGFNTYYFKRNGNHKLEDLRKIIKI